MIGITRRKGNQLRHSSGSEMLVIEPWGPHGLRVRATCRDDVEDVDWALTEEMEAPQAEEFSIEIAEDEAVIVNGRISARLSDNMTGVGSQPLQAGFLQFFRDRELVLSEYDYVVGAHNPGTRSYRPSAAAEPERQLYRTEVHFAPRDGERFYGLGLNDTGNVNLKGSVIDLYQRHVKHVVPFMVSSQGYGFLWNNPSLGRVELAENRTRWVSEGCRQIDYYITVADSHADILDHYTRATGRPPVMPEWGTGFWQCKLRYQSREDLLSTAREFRKRGLPLSVIVIDFRHWKRIGDWSLDPEFWPDPESMVRELGDMGVRVMISPWILVEEKSGNFKEMQARGFFIERADGAEDWLPWNTDGEDVRARQYDPTNPKAADFLWSKWKSNYYDLGIRTFWLDPCDDLHAIGEYEDIKYHIGPAVEAHGFYPVAHQRNIQRALHEAGEPEVVTICRSSWAGSQRYAASPAAHDIKSSFEHLERYMKAGLNLSMSGIPWGAAEIGGFVTPDSESEYFQELMVRWYQYGVFTPVFRTHGYRQNNEAWNLGGDTYSHVRSSMLMRESLRPYVMDQMRLAASRGTPPMRPLCFDFEHDPDTHSVEDQFLFGPDLLIAPVTAFGQRSRTAYLPIGADWVDVWSGASLAGGCTTRAEAPLSRIPIFAREGRSPVDFRQFESRLGGGA